MEGNVEVWFHVIETLCRAHLFLVLNMLYECSYLRRLKIATKPIGTIMYRFIHRQVYYRTLLLLINRSKGMSYGIGFVLYCFAYYSLGQSL